MFETKYKQFNTKTNPKQNQISLSFIRIRHCPTKIRNKWRLMEIKEQQRSGSHRLRTRIRTRDERGPQQKSCWVSEWQNVGKIQTSKYHGIKLRGWDNKSWNDVVFDSKNVWSQKSKIFRKSSNKNNLEREATTWKTVGRIETK